MRIGERACGTSATSVSPVCPWQDNLQLAAADEAVTTGPQPNSAKATTTLERVALARYSTHAPADPPTHVLGTG